MVKVIDFGISLELSREIPGIKNPNVLEGTLGYISPEQTGRMNRFLDYRTDYYSLGITFYRMLCGRLPFESTDAMELVYAHIARQAPALHELDESIPRAVSDIVQKLMEKNAEDRYQSSHGLAADLGRCMSEWKRAGVIRPFELGREDVSNRFHVPQKLYGREEEVKILLNAFRRVGQGERELMLVSGLPGIGKSALLNEIQKPIMKLRGNYIAGKFDKFNRDVPYSALLQAFAGLVKHLLAENPERLAAWKQKILEALGPNGRVITDVIPELELVIGEQGEIPVLGPEESRNRFNLYFQFFMGVFCKEEHPLVLFLDDLQWADQASLDMIKLFLSDSGVKYLFVIGSFRSNEVDAAHGLSLMLNDVKKTSVPINFIDVSPLKIEAITDLIRDSLHCDRKSAGPLADLLLRKTGGNPFFLGEFLKSLYGEELLVFQSVSGWSWDVQKIKALQVTDNVVELMANKIIHLPGDCAELLKLGACFGDSFRFEDIVELTGKTRAKVRESLIVLLEAGLLFRFEYKYNFAHDRIQEAAYSLISEAKRKQEHHRIGRLVLEGGDRDKTSENLFYIVNHLNVARELIDSESERLELLELNLQAGSKARASAAYKQALNYLKIGLGLLESGAWNKRYDLTFQLYQEATIAAYLCGNYPDMDELAEAVIGQARDVLDTVVVYEARIFAAMGRNQAGEAIRIGMTILRQLGLRLPSKPGKFHVFLGLLSVKWALRGMSTSNVEERPLQEDPRDLAIARINSSIGSSSYLVLPDLLPLLIFINLKLANKKGDTQFTPYTYAGYGYIHCGILGDIDKGYELGQLALKLIDKLNLKDGKARPLMIVQYWIVFWKKHLRSTLEPLREASRAAMETGDPEFFCHAANTYTFYSIFSGRDLTEVDGESGKFHAMVENLKMSYALNTSHFIRQLILNLRGFASDPLVIKGESFDIELLFSADLQEKGQNNMFAAHFFTGLLSFMFGHYENALEQIISALEYTDKVLSSYYIPLSNFYKSLTELALYPNVIKSRRKRFLRNVRANQKKMKHWAAHAPMNFEHKYLLVEAELARVLGQELKARDLYEQAIQGAHENQYVNEEALALELFAKFWLESGKTEIAALYMSKAKRAYAAWGARAKVINLEQSYPQLVYEQTGTDDRAPTSDSTLSVNTATERATSGRLDLATVMKGSQAISGEIVLGNLLRKMIEIVMENAGARSAYLILESKDELYVEAAGDLESGEVTVLQSQPLDKCEGLSSAVVNYAARTKENVVLNDASNAGDFTGDKHILLHKPKSILCTPILNQGNLSGILYLENNLSRGAFTADRLEVLNLLSSQIAVSIDNARLYGNLEDKVQERTAELSDTLGQVQELKNKQDGDYFLTSLLINPLARNEVDSERVKVDFLVNQKKNFKFDKWENELGGDMCIAHSVRLENSTFTVFLNADAMGKSMQGAGGALVLGAVFQSIMERTRLASFDEGQGATAWLQGVFLELQKVFESFDGSMLVSLVLGLVAEASGDLELINAEHPWTVLFRDGRANFIEDDISLHKLGSPEQEDAIHIYRARLLSGDVLIAGSDGRDDILLPGGEGSVRNINSDVSQFLRRVEEGGGELAGIKAALLKQGELTDDLSLLRLEYR